MQTQVTTKTVNSQPKRITGIAWAWGYEDGVQGKSEFTGYHLFVGTKLSEYRRGWTEGRRNVRH